VAFAAIVNDAGGYDLLLLELHPDSNVSDAKKAAGTQTAPDSTPPDTSIAKGIATITAVQPGSLTLNFVERPLAGQNVTAALAPDVVYMAGDQKCVDPALAAGQQIGVVLHRGDGDTYTVQQVVLFQSS
jgi:hypothetical protein